MPQRPMYKVWRKVYAADHQSLVATFLVGQSSDMLQAERMIETDTGEPGDWRDQFPSNYITTIEMEYPSPEEIAKVNMGKCSEIFMAYNVAVAAISTAESRLKQLGKILIAKGIIK